MVYGLAHIPESQARMFRPFPEGLGVDFGYVSVSDHDWRVLLSRDAIHGDFLGGFTLFLQ